MSNKMDFLHALSLCFLNRRVQIVLKEAFNAVFCRWVTDIGDLIAINPKEFFDWLHSDITATHTV
jgi:hypothetical protein